MNKKIITLLCLTFLFEQRNIYAKPTTQASREVNSNLQTIMGKLNDLPEEYRPADIKKAMKLMLQGKFIWKSISENKLYSALDLKIDDPKIALIVKNCLEKSPDTFWVEIHNNQKIQLAIEQANVPFTRETCNNPEYFMLFRMTYLKAMIQNEEIIGQIQESYENSVIALQWFLYAQALLENETFLSAVITILDKNLSLFYFLDGYAELISPRYRLYSALSIHSWWQSDAHTQITRHWKHKKLFKDAAFGINFKNKNKEIEYVLPLNNAHLIFGILDNKLTFIKWQKRGPHVVDLVKNRNSIEAKLIRNDKIPKDVLLQFKSLFGHPLTRHQSHVSFKDGISAMIQMLDDQSKKLFLNFLKTIKKYNSLDNNLRKGNEIILNPNRFKDFNSI
jgi:hypothetical protein